MAPVFPLAKLAFLFVKQVARPLSSSIKRRAVSSIFFREKFCLPPAKFYHWCEVRMKMYVMNSRRSSKTSTIPKLNEKAAIELGANLLGEGIIFSIAAAILAFEVSRQKEKERKKEEMEQNVIDTLQSQVSDLMFATEELDTKLREANKLLSTTQQELREIKTSSTAMRKGK